MCTREERHEPKGPTCELVTPAFYSEKAACTHTSVLLFISAHWARRPWKQLVADMAIACLFMVSVRGVHTRTPEADLVASPEGNRRHQGTQGNKGHNTTDKPLHSALISLRQPAVGVACSCNAMWCGISVESRVSNSRNKCGTSAAQVRNKCEASAEHSADRVRNAGRCAARRLLAKTPPKKHKNTPKSTKTPKKTKKTPNFFFAFRAVCRYPCGFAAERRRHRCGTGAAPVRHRCGTGAAPVRIACGTPADRRRTAGGPPADLRRGVLCVRQHQKTGRPSWGAR